MKIRKINPTTFQAPIHEHLETVIGDEKQKQFFPRVKIKKWDNEVNFSVGPADAGGWVPTLTGDTITAAKGGQIARFYPKSPKQPVFDTSYIRLTKLGAIAPHQIGAVYEVVDPAAQSINVHWSDRFALMYYGYYEASSYLDLAKVGNIPQMRVAMWGHQNGPMVMDESLKLIDIRYNEQRDDKKLIKKSIITAVKNVLAPYKIDITDTNNGKLYFTDGDKQVKFFSGAFIGGHYYFYINLGLDYNNSHDYYRDDVKPATKDTYAYGLRAVADIPDSIVDNAITEYAKLYGLPLQETPYSLDEQAELNRLNQVHQQDNWILHARRNDVYNPSNDPQGNGFEFEIELKQAPVGNVVPLTVQTKELAFYYQPGLTAEERLSNHLRPPNVVGSYAAYHVSKSNNEYQTGKAFHIYRPWATDSTGKKVWCKFDPGWDGTGDLNITIPQDFLDSAVYPVIIDPTFGYDAAGGSNVDFDNIIKGTVQTVPSAPSLGGTLTSISMYLNTTTNATTAYEGAVYNSAGTTRIAESTNGSTSGVASWRTLDFASQSITASTDYILAAWGNNTGTAANYDTNYIYYDTTSGSSRTLASTYSIDAWPADISSAATESPRRYSIYVTYAGIYDMSFPLFGATTDNPVHGDYIFPNSTNSTIWNADTTLRDIVVTESCSISQLNVQVATAPGAGSPTKSRTYTLYKNGSPTALTTTISATAVTNSDSTNRVPCVAGDRISLRITTANTPATAGDEYWNMLVSANNAMVLAANGTNLVITSDAVRYFNPNGGYVETYATVETDFQIIVPTSGTLKNLYINLSAAPGAAASAKSYAFALMLNGVATALTATVLETVTTANDTSNTVAVSAGDVISMRVTTSAVSPTTSQPTVSMSFAPTVLGQSFFGFGNAQGTGSTTVTRYEQTLSVGLNAAWNVTESLKYMMIGAYLMTKIYAKVTTDPGGAGKTWTITLRNNAATTGLTVALTTTAIGNTTANVLPTAFQFQSLEAAPTSTPAATGGVHTGVLIVTAYSISVSDSTAVTDSTPVTLLSYVNVSDSSAVTDSPTVTIEAGLSVNVSDSTTVTDSPTVVITSTSGPISISVSDAATASDIVTVVRSLGQVATFGFFDFFE